MATVELNQTIGVPHGAFVMATDPGGVGAGKLWVSTASGPPYTLYVRNGTNTGWEAVAAPGGGGAGGGALPAGGVAGNLLVKQSATDGDAAWEAPGAATPGTYRWEALANGDPDDPALIYSGDGDLIYFEVAE